MTVSLASNPLRQDGYTAFTWSAAINNYFGSFGYSPTEIVRVTESNPHTLNYFNLDTLTAVSSVTQPAVTIQGAVCSTVNKPTGYLQKDRKVFFTTTSQTSSATNTIDYVLMDTTARTWGTAVSTFASLDTTYSHKFVTAISDTRVIAVCANSSSSFDYYLFDNNGTRLGKVAGLSGSFSVDYSKIFATQHVVCFGGGPDEGRYNTIFELDSNLLPVTGTIITGIVPSRVADTITNGIIPQGRYNTANGTAWDIVSSYSSTTGYLAFSMGRSQTYQRYEYPNLSNYNRSPYAPTNLYPSGISASPATVHTLTPTLSWSMNDPDPGNVQSAYQIQLFANSGTLIWDTQQVNSSSNSFVIPSSIGLQPNTVYYWSVRTWDNNSVLGPYSTNQYFKTSQAPTATNLTPGNASSNTPEGCSVTPRFSWTYSDAEGDVQSAYQVKIYNPSTSLLVYDSQKVSSSNAYLDIPSGVLGAGLKYYWNVTVWDSTQMASTSANEYILTNNPPAPVTLISPTNTYRVTTRPAFVANVGDDVENDKQHFKLQIASDAGFTSNVQEFSTLTSQTGWEAYNGTAWVAFAAGGLDFSYEGKQVRYTCQSDLTEGRTYYWRMAPIDGTTGSLGTWSSVRSIRVGDTLQFKLKNAMKTSTVAKKVLMTGRFSLPSDGVTAASLKIEVCNNALDTTPTWEDATNAFISGQYYLFTNATKTNANWAVDCRVTIKANDSLGTIEFDGIGFTIE